VTPVQASVVPQGSGQANSEPLAVIVPKGFDDPVVQAKVMRSVNLDRKTTDAPWAAFFVVALIAAFALGSYQVGNAIDVVGSRETKLADKHGAGEAQVWCDFGKSSTEGRQFMCALHSMLGPSFTGREIPVGARHTTANCATGTLVSTDANYEYQPFCRTTTTPIQQGNSCPMPGGTIATGRRQLRGSNKNAEPPPPPAYINLDGDCVRYDDGSGVSTCDSDDDGPPESGEGDPSWKDYSAAHNFCSQQGARLCTFEELGYMYTQTPCAAPWALQSCDGGHKVYDDKGGYCAHDCVQRPVHCCAYQSSASAAAVDEAIDTAKYAAVSVSNQTDTQDDVDVSLLLAPTIIASIVCIVFAVIGGIMYIYGMRGHPRALTWFANLAFPAFMCLIGFVLLGISFFLGAILIIFGLIGFCMVWCWRAQLELTAQLLKISTQGLLDNYGLIGTNIILQIIQTALEIPMVIFLIASNVQSGDWSRELPEMPADACASISEFHFEGSPTRYFHAFMLIWIGMLLMEMVVHNIGATIAMWYFHRNDDNFNYPDSPAMTTLTWGFGSGFGSLCMASFILTVVRIIVEMINQAERNARESGGAAQFVMCILACIANYLEYWIQFITKLSVITVAITNQQFWTSCKQTMGILFRNYLDGVVIDRFAKMTLQFFAMFVALVMAVLGYFLAAAVLPDEFDQGLWKLLIAIFVCIIVFCVLMLLSGTVLIIINTLYMTYNIDLDHNFAPSELTVEIHEMYKSAIDGSISAMVSKPGKNFAKTGPGRREAERQQKEMESNGLAMR